MPPISSKPCQLSSPIQLLTCYITLQWSSTRRHQEGPSYTALCKYHDYRGGYRAITAVIALPRGGSNPGPNDKVNPAPNRVYITITT
uniref:Uncharacterized protein n=1 Tax=Oryza barthii TaxID=65489 RepID=A0A0D3ESQ4_9ORYZ